MTATPSVATATSSSTRRLVAAALVAGSTALAQNAVAAEPGGPCTVRKEINVPAKMRDGTILYADIYRPVEEGSYPVLLQRLPYNKTSASAFVYGPPAWYAAQCYIHVIQDVRGQYASEGTFYPFRNEMTDGYDSVEWAAQLPQSSGKVGMYGFSYTGATQWLAATQKPPHLVAIAPGHTASDYYDGWSYEGGAFSLAFEESWPIMSLTGGSVRRLGDQSLVDKLVKAQGQLPSVYAFLPIKSLPWLAPEKPQLAGFFYEWVQHSNRDEYWKQWSIRERYKDIAVPAFNYGGWYDVFLNGTIENFTGMRRQGGTEVARGGQKLLIRPYHHMPWDTKVGEVEFGPQAANKTNEQLVRWYDHWLKGKDNGVDRDPAVRVFVMGANTWRDAEEWPIPGTQFTTYYLHSHGQANSLYGNGSLSTEPPASGEPVDRYVYDPANPVPSKGGHSCCVASAVPQGPYDQSDIEKRADVLVYSTPALAEPVEVTGPITVTLYAATSAVDTDWTAKLVDVFPDGKAINLNNGIIRASHRNSLAAREPVKPGMAYAYKITVWPTSNLFAAGHQIRLEISSSNFPHYDRNLNTGHALGADSEMVVARQTVYHDRARPSQIVLPIMPAPVKTADAAPAIK
jgi:putative CocE/NonD family hydrolase